MNLVVCVDTSLLTDQAECNRTTRAYAFQIPAEKSRSLFWVSAVPAVRRSLWQVHVPSTPGRTSASLEGIARERAGTELKIVSIPRRTSQPRRRLTQLEAYVTFEFFVAKGICPLVVHLRLFDALCRSIGFDRKRRRHGENDIQQAEPCPPGHGEIVLFHLEVRITE